MTTKNNKILFYSSVSTVSLFETQKFYKTDIIILKELNFTVAVTNKISDFLFFWKYDIAFIYFYRKGLFPAIISQIFGKKVYFTGGIDDLNENTTNNKNYFIQKVFFKLCNLFSSKSILVSLSDQANVRDIYLGKLPKNIDLSFHTINSELFYVNDLSIKECIFTTIAWMESIENVKRKGVDKALFVFKQLTEKNAYFDAKFYVIGKEGIGTEYLRQLSKELDISHKVVFTGSIDEILKIDYLKKSKFYFQLSTFEGFGIAALEALAAKNIVIHSGKGGLKETMKNYGVILDINESLTEQIDYLYNELSNFRSDKLSSAYEDINSFYSNISRQKYFEGILKN
jgi:glycosyltransferase involved in cell wall biosynthesis